MTNKETQQLGKLTGQVEMLIVSVGALHEKLDNFRNNCAPCKKDILESARQAALTISTSKSVSLERWVTRGIISILVLICGYLFIHHFIPDVVNPPIKAEIHESIKK